MESNFTSAFFAGNRQRLRELFAGNAPIVITANGLLQRGGDSTFAFAQDANFWYLTGIDEPDIVLVMDRDKEYLIVPSRSASREAFDGAVAADSLSERSGIADVRDDRTGWEQLSSKLKRSKHIATIAPAPFYLEQYGMYTNPARRFLIRRLKSYNPNLQLLDISAQLRRQRMIKQPEELRALQRAIGITTHSIETVLQPDISKSYAHEYEIEAELTLNFRRQGSIGHAFEPIVASGPRACTLHNVSNNSRIGANELIVIDTGAEVEHYAADITRTVVHGKASNRQRAIYDAVLDVQAFALGLLKPGVLLRDYEKEIEQYMGKQLQNLKLITTADHENVRKYYPHATSHFLGLNVHDVGDYDRPLEAGVVLTVEPGIYVPEESIGVRIEDDVLITDAGTKVLSDALPRKL